MNNLLIKYRYQGMGMLCRMMVVSVFTLACIMPYEAGASRGTIRFSDPDLWVNGFPEWAGGNEASAAIISIVDLPGEYDPYYDPGLEKLSIAEFRCCPPGGDNEGCKEFQDHRFKSDKELVFVDLTTRECKKHNCNLHINDVWSLRDAANLLQAQYCGPDNNPETGLVIRDVLRGNETCPEMVWNRVTFKLLGVWQEGVDDATQIDCTTENNCKVYYEATATFDLGFTLNDLCMDGVFHTEPHVICYDDGSGSREDCGTYPTP
jgi:hypothetical protein